MSWHFRCSSDRVCLPVYWHHRPRSRSFATLPSRRDPTIDLRHKHWSIKCSPNEHSRRRRASTRDALSRRHADELFFVFFLASYCIMHTPYNISNRKLLLKNTLVLPPLVAVFHHLVSGLSESGGAKSKLKVAPPGPPRVAQSGMYQKPTWILRTILLGTMLPVAITRGPAGCCDEARDIT